MYVTVTRKKYKDHYHEQILLRESYRENGKVKSRTLLNLTNKPKEQVEAIIAALKNKDDIVISAKNQSQGKTIGLSYVIIFIMRLLGVIKAIGNSFEAKIALTLIASRVAIQSSRLQALFWVKEDKILDLLKFDAQEKERLNDKTVYKGLDYLQENQEKIEKKLFKAYYGKNPPKRVFYDVTSSYVEGEYLDSELVTYGYNRDKKRGKKQIVIGLLIDENGHAISIQVYPGNTNDIKTFTDQLKKLKKRFDLENITIVGDGGMIKSEDIVKIKEMGFDYITSIPKASIKKLINSKLSKFDISLFDEELEEIVEDNTRYILRQNPIRRDEIRENRELKIKYLKEFIESKKEYYNTHYKAKKETLEKNIINKISDLKLNKFISVQFKYKDTQIAVEYKDKKEFKTKQLVDIELLINQEAKKEIEQLDGCYVIKTSLTNSKKDTKEDIHKAYKTLIKVENAFKTLKTDFLEIRPLYLKTDKRIKGHIALSMIAYNITLKLKSYINLAKLDFKDTVRKLSTIKTTINQVDKFFSFETIAKVNEDLQKLFNIMNLKFPTRI